MLTIRKRGRVYHADLNVGNVHRVRGSLGTRNRDTATRFRHKLEIAIAEGSKSTLWMELGRALPAETFGRFAEFAGVKNRSFPTWQDLRTEFMVFLEKRVKLGKLADSTVN